MDYLDLVSEREKGFSYQAYKNDNGYNGGQKKLFGMLGMKATMRHNLELYGLMLFLDKFFAVALCGC